MKKILYKKNNLLFFFLIIIFLGFLLRAYNINYDDLWSDEIVSFWLSDPLITFEETLIRIFSSNWMVFYEISLKYFHYLFGYEVNISRHFSLLISLLSLTFFGLLISKITKKEAAILGLFILSINIYHIKYSIELRSYIFAFFLVTLFIHLVFKNNVPNQKKNIFNLVILNLITVLMLFTHPFTLLVVGSYLVFELTKFYKKKIIKSYNIKLIISLMITMALFLMIYSKTTLKIIDQDTLNGISPDWLLQVKPQFYTNFYFSKYFGSRLLGLIHLSILLYCVIRFRKKLIQDLNIYTFFVILIFFSYFIPLIYGYLFEPILLDRYIFFVLIPIICLLSHFILQINSKFLKYFFIILICVPTFLNHLFYENTGKQFYANINPTKPDTRNALEIINSSDTKIFTFKKYDLYTFNLNSAYENYLLKYLRLKNYDLEYFSYKEFEKKPNKIWIVYYKDINKLEFKIPKKFTGYRVIETKSLNNIDLFHLSKL
jgi:hypothetical protein